MAEKKTSPWVYIGCGCLLIVAIVIVGGIGSCMYLAKKGADFVEGMKDPVVRQEKALDVLGAEALPEGYTALFGLDLLGFFEIAVIGTGSIGPDGETMALGDEGLVYLKMPFADESQKQEMQDFFDGKTNSLEALRQSNINVNASQMLTRGTLQSGDMGLQYVTSRGGVTVEGSSQQGLVTVVMISCEGDSKQRIGVWYGPEPTAGASSSATAGEMAGEASAESGPDLAGSVGDEVRIQQFFDGFDLCL